MQSSSWTGSYVDAEQYKSSNMPSTEAEDDILDSLVTRVHQSVPLSAANAEHISDATLRKSNFQSMVPRSTPQRQPSLQSAATGRSSSSWSTFLEHGNDCSVTYAKVCDDQYAASDADDELVTAID